MGWPIGEREDGHGAGGGEADVRDGDRGARTCVSKIGQKNVQRGRGASSAVIQKEHRLKWNILINQNAGIPIRITQYLVNQH